MIKVVKVILKYRSGETPKLEVFHLFQERIFGRRRLLWTRLGLPSANSYAEALTLNVTIFGDRDFEVIK